MKIGLEFEFPLIKDNFEAAEYADTLALWRQFEKMGWNTKIDPSSKQTVGCYTAKNSGEWVIGTDYGVCELEIAPPPAPNLPTAEQEWNDFLRTELLPSLAACNLKILGFATQPITTEYSARVAPKGHYKIVNAALGHDNLEAIQPIWAASAAAQYNIDVNREKIVDTANALIKLAPLFWAWSANSSIYNCKIQEYVSNRALMFDFFDSMNVPVFKNRLSFPTRPYKNISDYISMNWEYPILEIFRNGKALSPIKPMTGWEFIKAGKAEFMDLNKNTSIERVTADDLTFMAYLHWMKAKIKIAFDARLDAETIVDAVKNGTAESVLTDASFIEVRSLDMCPQKNLFAWPALLMGCIVNINPLVEMTNEWAYDDLRACRKEVITKGLLTKWHGMPLSELGIRVFDIAKKGLQEFDAGLINYMEPLKIYAKTGRSPAHDANNVFKNQGIEGLIEYLTIGPAV